jgi:putative membrane protein
MIAQAAPPTMSSASSPTAGDKSFSKTAANAGMKEVKLGKLAETKASSAAVKQFAARMVKDHTAAGKHLAELASKKSVTLPSAPDSETQIAYSKLNALSGASFDKAYMAMMLEDHKKAVALFSKEANSNGDATFKSFAAETLPTLKHHLMMAETDNAQVNKGMPAGKM